MTGPPDDYSPPFETRNPHVTRCRFTYLLVTFLSCGVSVSVSLFPAFAGLTPDDHARLAQIAATYRQNRSAIKTWSGSGQVLFTQGEALGYDRSTSNSMVSFDWSADPEAVRWSWNRQESQAVKDGEEVSMGLLHRSCLLRDETFYEYFVGNDDMSNQLILRSGDDGQNLRYTDHINPIDLITVQGRDIDRVLESYMHPDRIDDSDFLKSDGSIVLFHAEFSSGDTFDYAFDLSKGGNLVDYVVHTNRYHSHFSYEYSEVDGVFVPVDVTYERNNIGPQGPGELQFRRQTRLTEVSVNQPMSPDLFTVEALGVKEGDVVQDTRIGLTYTYGASDQVLEGLGATTEPLAASPSASTRSLRAESEPDLSNPITASATSTVADPMDGPSGRTVVLLATVAAIAIAVVVSTRRFLQFGNRR